MKTTKLCVSVVCLDLVEKKVLLVFEKQDGKDVINVPSGHVEFGEDPYLAAHRELKEETSHVVDHMHFAGTTSLINGDTCYFTMVYACFKPLQDQIGGKIVDDEVYDAKWLTSEEVNQLKDKHRNGFIDDKIRMAVSCLTSVSDPINNCHTPYHRSIQL